MSYYNINKEIKETVKNKTVAIATEDGGAEIVVKALNYYFSEKIFTKNECLEMSYKNIESAFRKVAAFVKKEKMDAAEIIEFLIEIADAHEAQKIVIQLRDEINKPK